MAIRSLEEMLDDSQSRELADIRSRATAILRTPLDPRLTDHTIEHAERVRAHLDDLLREWFEIELNSPDRQRVQAEIFILLAAVYLHDIGMQMAKINQDRFPDLSIPSSFKPDLPLDNSTLAFMREHHHLITYTWLTKANTERGFPDTGLKTYIDEVAKVCRAHNIWLRDDSDHRKFWGELGEARRHVGRIRLSSLAAFLRMGDLLDLDRRRVNIDALGQYGIPDHSQAHWWKHHYIETCKLGDRVDGVGRRLHVTFCVAHDESYSHEHLRDLLYRLSVKELEEEQKRLSNGLSPIGVWIAFPPLDECEITVDRSGEIEPIPSEVLADLESLSNERTSVAGYDQRSEPSHLQTASLQLLESSGRKAPAAPIDPRVEIDEHLREFHFEGVLFPACLCCPGPVAFVAGPGLGKTVLLIRLARWLSTQTASVMAVDRHERPVGLFITMNDLPQEPTAENIWKWLENVLRTAATGSAEQDPESAVMKLGKARDAGLVYLLFDGLDELGTRDRARAHLLTLALSELLKRNVNVLLTCRESYWEKVRERDMYRVIKILPPTTEQAEQLLDGVKLPPTAYNEDGTLKEWILNPLLLLFVKSISHDWKIWKKAASSRSTLHEQWACHAATQAARRCEVSDETKLLDFSRAFAILLLEGRERRANFDDVRMRILGTDILWPDKLDSMDDVFLVTTAQSIEFRHESFYEFFATWALENDYQDAVSARESKDLSNRPLARVELDYLPSSFYGFLTERLGEQYAVNVKSLLTATPTRKIHWRILRNLVEFLGITYSGGDDQQMAELFLELTLDPTSLIDPKSLVEEGDAESCRRRNVCKIRFNAARALERIHPRAPRPYFDFISDWGGRDWTRERLWARSLREKARETDASASPWVMRGHHVKEAVPSRHSYFVPNDTTKHETMSEQSKRDVSKQLGSLMMRLLDAPVTEDMPLWINCTWAWVRWFHPDDEPIRKSVEEALSVFINQATVDGNKEGLRFAERTKDNITEWVGRDQSRVSED